MRISLTERNLTIEMRARKASQSNRALLICFAVNQEVIQRMVSLNNAKKEEE